MMKTLLKSVHFRRIAIIGLITLAVSLYLFLFHMKPTMPVQAERIPFDPEGFTDAMTLDDHERLVAENGNFALYIDETTSYFHVLDKRNGEVWQSNPSVPDPWEEDDTRHITTSALNRQKATLELTYFNRAGSRSSVNNYRLSINHRESVNTPEGYRTYGIKYIEDGFQVLYRIEDLEIDHLFFPKFLDKDVLEAHPQRNILEQIAYTGFNSELQAYEIVAYEDMSRLVRNRLYQIFYVDGDYTRERAIEENFSYGYTEFFEKVSFQIGIQVALHEKGVEISIIRDALEEPRDIRLARITPYPHFGTAISEINGQPSEGYIVLPDGSGAVMEFNNGKFNQSPYRKRLYGDDLSMMRYEMPEQQQDITIPLFGMVKENHAYAGIITRGEAMATLHADVSGRVDSYNKLYVSFALRESEAIVLGSGFNRYAVDLWTETIVDTDFTIRKVFLDGDDSDYVGIARAYRDHLLETVGVTARPLAGAPILHAEMIGAYDRTDFFLGIPHYPMHSMTTFEEAQAMVDILKAEGIEHIDIIYTGALNGGLSASIADRADFERVLGGEKAFIELVEAMRAQDVGVYPNVSLMVASDYRRPFDRFRYTASRIKGAHSLHFHYHYPTRLPYSETPYDFRDDDYVISPRFYAPIMERFIDDYPHDAIAFTRLGGRLGGDYDRSALVYRQDAIALQQDVLASAPYTTMLTNPYGYALPYADRLIDIPIETTLYAIVDYQIPLLQLVFAGLFDYSTPSLNLSHERSMEYKFLKILETGSHLKYTLSYARSRDLIDTHYNHYMSIQYENWLESMRAQIRELDEIGLHEGHLVGHERIRSGVYRVEYSHGLKILINYTLSDTDVDGIHVPATGYVLEGE